MCGIAAIVAYDDSAPGVDESELLVIRDHMISRGPDGEGIWFDPPRRVGLGHRRLSILDVSPAGAQPMLLPEKKLAITFNGEIYNYRELRANLEAKGTRFVSQCDTEVLLHLYAAYGETMLDRLRGMFAFALWDGVRQTLFVARDPFGIKPLYWADDGRTFRAASQVKALLAGGKIDTSPEPAGHVGYFLWGHIPAPYTLYRGIHNLPAGHCLTVELGGKIHQRPYSSIADLIAQAEAQSEKSRISGEAVTAPAENSDHRRALDRLRSRLSDSIRCHLIADVPVGVFLSAGLDSATIAALAAECAGDLRTVTLGFEEYRGTPNDEVPLAEQLARLLGARHQTIWVTRKDFEDDRHRLLTAMDQPTSDGVNSYFISKAAAQSGLKVALSGLGGDELFGGYPSFREIPRAISAFGPFASHPAAGRALRAVSAPFLKHMTSPKYAGLLEYGSTYGGAYLLRRSLFMPWELPEFLDGDFVREGWNELQTLARLDQTTQAIHSPHLKVSALEMTWYMRHQLLRDTDWASMAHSLEVRVPLVDTQLLRDVAPLLATERSITKRDMAQTPRIQFPPSILDRPKTGFSVPVRQWLLEENQNFEAGKRRSIERGLRGWAREVYSTFTGHLELHRTSFRRRRPTSTPPRDPVGTPPAAGKIRALVLLSDGFGGFGGIAKFNRDFLTGLCSHPRMEQVVAVPRLMPEPHGPLPPQLTQIESGLGGKGRYIAAVVQSARKFQADRKSGAQTLIICGHLNLLPAALLAQRICGGGLYLIIHGVDAWNPAENPLTNASVRRIDGFISVSNLTKRRFMRWSGLRDDQGVVLPNCVDLGDFTPGPKPEALLDLYRLRGKKVMLTLGRLASEERYKGFDEVMEIMPALITEIPDLYYMICGDGPDRSRLERKAVQFGIHDRVIFAGRISEAAKLDHYRLADLFIMPSSGEGFGIVFLEALACGLPVIGSKVDGSREALLEGRLGSLVDPLDREDIIAAVLKVLKSPAPRPETPVADGYSVDHFSAKNFERRLHAIIDSMAPAARP